MRLKRALHLVLVLALLGAWQGSLVHPLVHADAHGLSAGPPVAQAPQSPDGGAPRLRCDALAAVAICIGSTPGSFTPCGTRPERSRITRPAPAAVASLLAYHSQAPPAALL